MPETKLTPKQALFVQEYIVDWNGSRAARAAGYSKKADKEIASENLTKPNIQRAIAEAMQKNIQSAEIDAKWVLEKSKKIVDVGLEERIVDKQGSMDFIDANNANKALDRIAKATGGFRDEIKVQADIKFSVVSGFQGTPGSEGE